jgi:D-3-phosphoglycerate dehydrogenase
MLPEARSDRFGFSVTDNSPQPPQFSLPKDRIRILLLEGVNDSAVEMMTAAGYSSIERLPKALGGDALREAVRGVHLIGIRSRTQIDAEILGAADRLIAIGRQWKG